MVGAKPKVVVDFLLNLLDRVKQPRQDYLEFIKLSLVVLGETERFDNMHFSPPGAYHRARWMAKGIYCLKIFCFREQFKMNAHELQAMKRICIFTLTVYVKAWFSAPMTCDAPYNDLCLLQNIESYDAIDSQVAKVALNKMKGHLWYLSEDLVGLSLFSDQVNTPEKKLIVAALKRPAKKSDLRRVDPKTVKCFQKTTLSEFTTKRSLNLFTALKLNKDFLSADPEIWDSREDFNVEKKKVAALRVVNDCAERSVKLATDFNLVLTHDEEQRQLIFQVVEHHRKQMALPLKKNFADNELDIIRYI